MTKPILISHELSNIGKLDITLHGIAAQFYAQLDKDGLVDYLKGLDHLGFISKCHPGNHHKRWDYVCLQLFFLQKLKHSKFNTGLNRNSEIGTKEASNQEIIQTFILFSNVGHLEGTLASERGLFDFLASHPTEKDIFLGEISKRVELKSLADKIFATHDFYKVKYLIALNYVLKNCRDERIVLAICLILKKYLFENDVQFEKLKILYFKIRKVCFVYLDSFHCQIPMQINISKILVNIFNYDLLFNPIDSDYDSILDTCETALSKELYISPKSSLTYGFATQHFNRYLVKFKAGPSKINYENFLTSLVKDRKETYVTKFPPSDYHILHFYLAKDALKFFELPINSNFDSGVIELHKNTSNFNKLLNKGLAKKRQYVVIQHDMRKSLVFFTFLINKNIDVADPTKILRNFNGAFLEIIDSFDFDEIATALDSRVAELLSRNFSKDVIRRYFLYVLKFLLEKENRLNLFITFKYRQFINQKNSETPTDRIYETSFADSKKDLISDLDNYLKKKLPTDIENNVNILKHIVQTETTMKRGVFSFYSIFPIEIEEMAYSARELDDSGNPEERKTLTDIDAMLVLFQGNKYEFYLIEGKKKKKNFWPSCKRDLLKIKALCTHSGVFSEPVKVEGNNFKGGYLKITA